MFERKTLQYRVVAERTEADDENGCVFEECSDEFATVRRVKFSLLPDTVTEDAFLSCTSVALAKGHGSFSWACKKRNSPSGEDENVVFERNF